MHAMIERSGLSERSFNRRFEQATGMGTMDFVHTLRLEEARHMLETTTEPVEAVAGAGRRRALRRPAAGLCVMAVLIGCSSSGIERNADGTLSIECSGGYHDWSQCYQRAARACRPDEVDIVSRVSDEGSSGVGTRDWSVAGSEVSRTLVVRCRT